MTACFHCGETVPKGVELTASIHDIDQPMCCIGCQAAATLITGIQQEAFYLYRQSELPSQPMADRNTDWSHLDQATVLQETTVANPDGSRQVTIKVDGMYCSACAWLIQKMLGQYDGISDCRINTVTQKVQVDFNPTNLRLSEIFSQIERLGYQPMPQDAQLGSGDASRKKQLKQLAVAGFGMMFIMTLAVPLYSPENLTVAPQIKQFFLMVSLLVATLVYFYAGQSFVLNAWRDLKNRHLGMDVPIALSISLAYFVSLYLSFSGGGHVYFDSMAMFVFFLLLGRFVESSVRHQGMDVHESLTALVPVSAEKYLDQHNTETVPLNQLSKGDQLRVEAGQVIPADGQVTRGRGQVNEAQLTGESKWISKRQGDFVYAGSKLTNGELVVTISVDNKNNFIAQLANLMEQAQSQKPASLQLVDRLAGYFVSVVLLLASGTALWYAWFNPAGMMPALLAVLIATCPCALSLATPTALTAGGIRLLRQGLLINNTDAITHIHTIDHWFFDKTGTLSEDHLTIEQSHLFHGEVVFSSEQLLPIAASLQQVSNHPIASAFKSLQQKPVLDAKEVTGLGVSGMIEGQLWHMGSQAWMETLGVEPPSDSQSVKLNTQLTHVYLACETTLVAIYELNLPVRAGAEELIAFLNAHNKTTAIISGDQSSTVRYWAEHLGIAQGEGMLSPSEKIARIAEKQADQYPCVMVGDGVNDAPVLAQADVSISLKQGAHLAHAAADMIVLGKSLEPIISALKVSRQTQRIIRQNLLWAAVYNLSITPLAMMGYLAPWMAAIGMSLSSLLVVLNSRRLLSGPKEDHAHG